MGVAYLELMNKDLRSLNVFIGSSSEGLPIARAMHAELEAATNCTIHRWDVGTFAAGSFTLDALVETAHKVDFAILIATGEDTLLSRGKESKTVRDNIIFEFGLFLGTLGRDRVYWLSADDAKIPSDLRGLTRLNYKNRDDGNIQAGLTAAVLEAEKAMTRLGTNQQPNRPELSTISEVATVVDKAINENSVTGETTQRKQSEWDTERKILESELSKYRRLAAERRNEINTVTKERDGFRRQLKEAKAQGSERSLRKTQSAIATTKEKVAFEVLKQTRSSGLSSGGWVLRNWGPGTAYNVYVTAVDQDARVEKDSAEKLSANQEIVLYNGYSTLPRQRSLLEPPKIRVSYENVAGEEKIVFIPFPRSIHGL